MNLEYTKRFSHRFTEIAQMADIGRDKEYGHALAMLEIDIEKYIEEIVKSHDKELIKKIKKIQYKVIEKTGSYKWDSCYEDCINIIKNHEKDN